MKIDSAALLDWANRAAADLRSYAEAGEAAGSPQDTTEALLKELTDLKRGRAQWLRAPGIRSGPVEPTSLDQL